MALMLYSEGSSKAESITRAEDMNIFLVQFPADEPRGDGTLVVSDQNPEHCTTVDGQSGRCVFFDSCNTFMVPRPNFSELRRHLCGFVGHVPKVCCPNPVVRSLDHETIEPTVENITAQVMTMSSDRPSVIPTDCGRPKASHRRIVNGEESDPGTWPWLVALFIEERGIKSAECGGALISANYVITAAHCVTGLGGSLISPRRLTVRLGDHHLFATDDGASAVDISVDSVVRHSQFEQRTFLNDIALLRLREPAVLNDFVHPICLPYDQPIRSADLENRTAFVAGWGTTSFDGPSSPVVRQVQVPVWNETACRDAYRNDVNLTSAYLCAGYEDGGKDACQGDSGGPLMLPVSPGNRFHLIGIVSFGKQCARPGFPGVYTNLRQFLPWISSNVH